MTYLIQTSHHVKVCNLAWQLLMPLHVLAAERKVEQLHV